MTELTKKQKETMKKHEKHHTKEHMSIMRSEMRKGKTFSQSHKTAMVKAGK
jgi:hypothetical protein|tara:strand:- start:578 stop:730 length:153 start_codon:yes stop_codon:yes gene_type:complete